MGLPVVSGVAWQVCIWNADITKWWVISYQSLGVGGRRFDELVTVVDTVGCLDDNLWCHQWWRGCRTGDVLLSVMVILNMFFLYVYFVSGCNKAFIYLILSYLNVDLSAWSFVIHLNMLKVIALEVFMKVIMIMCLKTAYLKSMAHLPGSKELT